MTSLEGRIVEHYSGKGVPGVTVTVGGISVLTDSSGRFKVTNLAAGQNYSISTNHPDFQSFSEAYALSEDRGYSTGDIRLMSTRVRAL